MFSVIRLISLLSKNSCNMAIKKLKLPTKLVVEATVFSVPFKNYIINIFQNQINFKITLL
jgi:hypothetical protein